MRKATKCDLDGTFSSDKTKEHSKLFDTLPYRKNLLLKEGAVFPLSGIRVLSLTENQSLRGYHKLCSLQHNYGIADISHQSMIVNIVFHLNKSSRPSFNSSHINALP